METTASLDQLASSPGLADSMPVTTAVALLLKCATAQAAIATRLLNLPEQRTNDEDQLLVAKEMAGVLGVPETWIRDQERAGKIPSVRPGKYVRFRPADVIRAIEERKDRS
jgi:excisionase family DNA binding protein